MWGWLAANKDALVALAAVVVSPAVALFGLMLTHRNMTRSLAVQRTALEANLAVADRQLANAERQFSQQTSVARAGIVSGMERQRLETFLARCARLLQLHDEVGNKESGLEQYEDRDEYVRLNREMHGIRLELELLTPHDLASLAFLQRAGDLIMSCTAKDLGKRLSAREQFMSEAKTVAALWRADISRIPGDKRHPRPS